MEFPVKVEVTPQASVVDTITQRIYEFPNFLTKINLLGELLSQEEFSRVIIFVRTKTNADNVYKFILRKISDSVRVIHGNKDQNTRLNSINDFKNGDVKVLVATDVAARGIDDFGEPCDQLRRAYYL